MHGVWNEDLFCEYFEHLLEETQLRLFEEFPQVLNYAGSISLECSKLSSNRVMLKTSASPNASSLPLRFEGAVVEQKAVAMHAA
ncbi:MAG: hypothetical protein AAGC73_02545 [Verrucomicrobiota bacterium]